MPFLNLFVFTVSLLMLDSCWNILKRNPYSFIHTRISLPCILFFDIYKNIVFLSSSNSIYLYYRIMWQSLLFPIFFPTVIHFCISTHCKYSLYFSYVFLLVFTRSFAFFIESSLRYFLPRWFPMRSTLFTYVHTRALFVSFLSIPGSP